MRLPVDDSHDEQRGIVGGQVLGEGVDEHERVLAPAQPQRGEALEGPRALQLRPFAEHLVHLLQGLLVAAAVQQVCEQDVSVLFTGCVRGGFGRALRNLYVMPSP